MILVKPSFEVWDSPHSDDLALIEKAGRICYLSEPKKTGTQDVIDRETRSFIRKRLVEGHDSVIEHAKATVKLVVDRGVSHELVRHRIASYSQESTRYCDYKGSITYIIPPWLDLEPGEYSLDDKELGGKIGDDPDALHFVLDLIQNEKTYQKYRKRGWPPERARGFLVHFVKTEIVVSLNFREWRHVFKLRTSKKAQIQMQEIMKMVLKEFRILVPVIFDDIGTIE